MERVEIKIKKIKIEKKGMVTKEAQLIKQRKEGRIEKIK
jgi:hypothetical protein